jgi:hypothetical protein
MNLLLWIIYDCDAHPANFRAYIKGYVGESAIYGLWKIDSSLSFPTKNQGFFSSLALLPNSFLPLSDSLKTAIEQLPCQKMLDLMQELGFEDSMQALQERVLFLQTFTKKEGVTFEEVCKRLVTF